MLNQLGFGRLFTHSSPGNGELLRELLWASPDWFLIGLAVITALAPTLAIWPRRTTATAEVDRVRRRRVIARVGLSGAVLMAALTQLDMALFRRAIDLGVELEGWDFGCVWPTGNYQAAFVGFGRLAVVLRIEAAVIDARARPPGCRGLWRVGLACLLAVCAAAPLASLGVEDFVAGQHPRPWVLPGVAYVVAFGLLELCARLGLLDRRSTRRRRTPRPLAGAPAPVPLQRPARGSSQPRATPDPAALAMGHRALARSRSWVALGVLAGCLAVVILALAGAGELLYAFEAREGFPLVGMLLLLCAGLGFVWLQAPLEADAPAPVRQRLPSPGLERAQLERGADPQFEESYYDFIARFEALAPDELEALATRGVDRVRVRSLPATWVDATRLFDAELRRGVHRELMQIRATIIGRPTADPYRADLGECGLVDSIGLGWLRRGKARDLELGQTHRSRSVIVLGAVLAWVAIAFDVGLSASGVPLHVCMPGVGECRFALDWLDWESSGLVLVTLSPLVVWVIGLAHHRVATRCFALALPSPVHDDPQLDSPLSSRFMEALDDLPQARGPWRARSLAACWVVLVTVVALSAWVSFGPEPWLERAVDAPAHYVLFVTLVSLALLSIRPIRVGHRRLCARVWLAEAQEPSITPGSRST
ncbi:hypothetical protein [Enhygromyxa salina]|uniref:hypothetical protein n=1 Tax=Enhygromyxa salina TaxID=215803 RepID=UPI000D02FB81|nr:hypothetical protein [Enhygromyxa salina]